jgi:two-component system, sensor histidine kinase and response regulator
LTIARDVTRERAAAAALASAKEAAEAANHAKSQFLANMSHEIRTPMNAVLGLSELQLSDNLSPAQRERALGIRTSAKALLEVINDVLDVSRIEAGKTELSEAEFSPALLFEDLQAMLRPLANEKGLAFEIRIDSQCDQVYRAGQCARGGVNGRRCRHGGAGRGHGFRFSRRHFMANRTFALPGAR